jgi:hypothetical protein
MTICVNNDITKNFVAPALPVPPVEYDQRYATDLIRILRLYFNQIDGFQNAVAGILNGTACEGNMTPLPVSIGGTNVDAFGRLRVSQPYTLFDGQNRYAADNQFDVATTGTGTTTFLSNEAAIKMEVTSGGVGSVTRQSFRSFPYQPGKGLLKSQILYMDIEWLGLGTVRMGFIINGVFVPAHNFDHANLTTTTYITTASLPMRYEIANTASTASASTLKQVCSTVISEGGYTLAGLQQSIGTPITTPKTLTTAGTYYPVVSLRLKTARLDAIIVLTAASILALTNNVNYEWRVVASGTTTGGTWVSAGTDSGVEYNITGTSFAGGRVLASGYTQGSNQGASTIDILKEALFANQLERNGLTGTAYELTLIASASSNTATIHASFDWEEVSR